MPAYVSRSTHRARAGFTLTEVMTVVIIIGVLAGILFAVGKGATDKGKTSQAKSEMAVIANALENFKSAYGDYPRVNAYDNAGTISTRADTDVPGFGGVSVNPAAHLDKFTVIPGKEIPGTQNPQLYKTGTPLSSDRGYEFARQLLGRTGPTRAIITTKVGTEYINARSFLEPAKFTWERTKTTDRPNGTNVFPVTPGATTTDGDFCNALLDPWGNRYYYLYRPAVDSPKTWSNPSYILLSAGKDGMVNSTFDATTDILTPAGDDIVSGAP